MDRWKRKKFIRILVEWWSAAAIFFIFYVFVPLGFYALIPSIAFIDTFVLERKGFFRNLIIDATIIGSYEIVVRIVYNLFQLPFADPFIYGFYHLFWSYVIYNKLTHLRVDNLEYL